jgi:ribonuclease E
MAQPPASGDAPEPLAPSSQPRAEAAAVGPKRYRVDHKAPAGPPAAAPADHKADSNHRDAKADRPDAKAEPRAEAKAESRAEPKAEAKASAVPKGGPRAAAGAAYRPVASRPFMPNHFVASPFRPLSQAARPAFPPPTRDEIADVSSRANK